MSSRRALVVCDCEGYELELLCPAMVPALAHADLLIEARPLGRGEPLRDSSELSLPAGGGPAVATRELRLRPGAWQARVVVRDPGSERLGSLLHTFEVPVYPAK